MFKINLNKTSLLIATIILLVGMIFILMYAFRYRKKRNNPTSNNAFLQEKREEFEKYIKDGMAVLKPYSIAALIMYFISIVSLFVFIYYLWQGILALPAFILIVLPLFIYAFIDGRSSLKFREKVITNVINMYNPDLEYLPKEGFSKEEYEKCRFNHEPFLHHSDNTIIDKKGTFRCADITADNGGSFGDDDIQVTWFTGMLARIDIKDVNCEIYMGDFKKKLLSKEYKAIDFGNDEFNKTFKAYTKDEVEARKLLTPHIMEQLVELKEKSDWDITIRILNDKLYIRFNFYFESFFSSSAGKKITIDNTISSLAKLQVVMDTMNEAKRIIEGKKK